MVWSSFLSIVTWVPFQLLEYAIYVWVLAALTALYPIVVGTCYWYVDRSYRNKRISTG